MKKLLYILVLNLVILSSCNHKDLCYIHREHAHRHHINLIAEYRYDWEECYGGTDWRNNWPVHFSYTYDELRPKKPAGLRVINYNEKGESNIHNLEPDGGVVNLYEGLNDILLYNNNTEYIIFSKVTNNASTRATTRASTRTRTRSTYKGSDLVPEKEETMTPPDILYANYYEGVYQDKVLEPEDFRAKLHPLVFTYKIRYEFAEGLEYVALARGALSGMASSVLMNTGETSEKGATLLFDCNMTNYGANALVNSFGIPGFPNTNYVKSAGPKHILNLELLLKNGKLLTLDYDVTDAVQKQPHGGVITVSDIIIKKEDGLQGSGAFDVEVNDWGEYQDVVLPFK